MAPAWGVLALDQSGGSRKQLDGNGDACAHPLTGNDTLWRLREGLQVLLMQAQGCELLAPTLQVGGPQKQVRPTHTRLLHLPAGGLVEVHHLLLFLQAPSTGYLLPCCHTSGEGGSLTR